MLVHFMRRVECDLKIATRCDTPLCVPEIPKATRVQSQPADGPKRQ